MDFGLNLKLARTKAKLTQDELAKKAGIGQTQLSRYERNKQTPSLEMAVKIAKTLRIDINELIKEEDKKMINRNELTVRHLAHTYANSDGTMDLEFQLEDKTIIVRNVQIPDDIDEWHWDDAETVKQAVADAKDTDIEEI